MSKSYGNPSVGPSPVQGRGLPDDLDYSSYNPSQVLLYGRPALPLTMESDRYLEEKVKKLLDKNAIINEKFSEIKSEIGDIIEELIRLYHERLGKEFTSGVFGQTITLAIFDGTEIVSLPIDIKLPMETSKGGRYIKSIGVIYGYAYEGHCYKLPKPQIMFLPDRARNIRVGDFDCDCGYDPELGYAVWQIDKLERVVALDVRSDDLKTLVLDENIPGRRSPQAYAQSMLLAPQRQHD